jgi:hypothetical protein
LFSRILRWLAPPLLRHLTFVDEKRKFEYMHMT